ncbi:MAG: YwbE family protein [Patescibacteria group bacterium]
MLSSGVARHVNSPHPPLTREGSNKAGTKRSDIKPGIKVVIVLKKDQPTGKLTEGVVKDILTSSANHHRGIKVRLTNGQVGRVQEIK